MNSLIALITRLECQLLLEDFDWFFETQGMLGSMIILDRLY